MTTFGVAAIEAYCYRVPIEPPLRASFGTMFDRPAVFVRAIDTDGVEGWGETWCNFPTVGAEHRARLVVDVVGPRFVGRDFAGPEDAFRSVGRELEVLVIQSGEVGPLAQALSGIDQALWDLFARRQGIPLYRALGGDRTTDVAVYASGLGPDSPERLAAHQRDQGHRAFKLKVGFSAERDVRNLENLRAALGAEATLMVDANQAYDLTTAVDMARRLAKSRPLWFEEPMRADAPLEQWHALAAVSPLTLAGGENLRGEQFDDCIRADVLGVIQPDVGKWGGLSATTPVGRRAVAAGKMFCPHWLTGGVGLVASLHQLAAVGGAGLLEVDANPNPLREWLLGDLLTVRHGRVSVPQRPGLGFVPDLALLEPYRTWPPRA